MGKNIFTLAMCVLFALSVVPFDVQEAGHAQVPYTQEAERTQSPFVIVTSVCDNDNAFAKPFGLLSRGTFFDWRFNVFQSKIET